MIVDLTIGLSEKMPSYPGDPEFKIQRVASIDSEGWNASKLSFSTHCGTHVDAPFHMFAKGKKLDEFSIEKFIGQAVVIDIRAKKPDLRKVQRDDIVFFLTGHTRKIYSGSFYKKNPLIPPEAAKELCKRRAKMIGIDSYSPDNYPFTVHKLLLKQDILIVENLINLEKLLKKRFSCFVLPLKLVGADAAPCRVIAVC